MIEQLYKKAEESIDSTDKLIKRLKIARSLLKTEYRKLFTNATVDTLQRRYVSECGHYALQWVNNGESSIGSCYLVVLDAQLLRVVRDKMTTPIS